MNYFAVDITPYPILKKNIARFCCGLAALITALYCFIRFHNKTIPRDYRLSMEIGISYWLPFNKVVVRSSYGYSSRTQQGVAGA